VVWLAVVFALYAGQYLAVLGLFPAMLVHDGGFSLRAAGVLGGLAFLVNASGNLLGAYLLHRGVARWRLVVAGSACMAATVWAGSDGRLMQGSSVGQLLVPPLVVAAGAASASWIAQPAVLSCLGLLAVLGGVLYRREDVAPAPDEAPR
jgi:hypothetical protein